MVSGGDNKGSIAGASAEQDDAGARADRPRTGMQDSCRFYVLPLCVVLQIVDLLPDPSDLLLRPIDIVALPPSEEDNRNDLLSPLQGYEVNGDEMGAISVLSTMKYQVPVHQPQTQQSKMDQNPNQLEPLALDGDHHQANAWDIPRRPRSHRSRIHRDQLEPLALDGDHHQANAWDIPKRPRSHRPRIH